MRKLALDGKKMLQLRTDKSMSRRMLGEIVEVNESIIRKYESEIIIPRAERIELLCNALGVDSEELFYYKDVITEREKIIIKNPTKNNFYESLTRDNDLINWDKLELDIIKLENITLENVIRIIKRHRQNYFMNR